GEEDEVVVLEVRFRVPERAARGRAVARRPGREAGRDEGEGVALVDVEAAGAMRGRVLAGVDAHAAHEAAEVVEPAGDERDLLHVALAVVGRQGGRAGG